MISSSGYSWSDHLSFHYETFTTWISTDCNCVTCALYKVVWGNHSLSLLLWHSYAQRRCHKTARVICFVSCCWLCWWRECTPACVRTRVCVCVFVSDVHGSRTMPIVLTIVTAFCCASAIWTRYKKQSEVPIVTFVFDMSGTLYSEDTYFRLKNKESICKRNWPVKVKPSVRMHMMVVEL